MGQEISRHRSGLAAGWNEVVPFFAYPPQVRRMIYTTNAIESLHRGLRKIIKTRGAFPSEKPPPNCSTSP